MENILLSLPEPTTDAEYEAAFDLFLQEMQRHQEQMERDRQEIERLKVEAQAIAVHTDAVLANIWKQLNALPKVG